MKPLEKIFVESGSRPMLFKGNEIPPWAKNSDSWENYDNWYNNSGINFFYNIVEEGRKTTTYIQYGRRGSGWAAARFLEQVILIDEEINTDKGIILKGKIKVPYFKGKETGLSQVGWNTTYKISVNNKVLYNFKGNSIDRFNKKNNLEIPFDVLIKPNEFSKEILLHLSFIYQEESGHQPNIFSVGTTFYNPNSVNYIPYGIRKKGKWVDLDSNKGFILKRKNEKWEDVSLEKVENILDENKGKNRIRKNNKWYQLPPFKK